MHENKHKAPDTSNLPGAENHQPTFEELLNSTAESMQAFALANPTLDQEELEKGIQEGIYSQFLKIQSTVYLHILLTISPADKETERPFWHCSMSLVSVESGNPKTFLLWTTRERARIKELLPKCLVNRGTVPSNYMQTKTALHFCKTLTDDELKIIGWAEPKQVTKRRKNRSRK
jgi:hypothetical protein